MAPNHSKLFVFFSLILFITLQSSRSDQSCHNGCGSVPIRFPFQMITNPPENRCGYPNFTATCVKETENMINFPHSGDFIIDKIDYTLQEIWISDPNNCTAERLLDGFDFSDTPFQPLNSTTFKLFNCSSDSPIFPTGAVAISCLSNENYSVVASSSDNVDALKTLKCKEMATISASSEDLLSSISLTWQEPKCQLCETMGGICRFQYGVGWSLACLRPLDLGYKVTFKYAAFFFAVSGLLIFAFVMYVRRQIKRQRQRNAEIYNSSNSLQRNVFAKGLDGPAIQMYPTTLVGETLELPKSADNICPICLYEYQAKETLRTIPSCMHYFHAECIDEWLKRNATCPLCRNY